MHAYHETRGVANRDPLWETERRSIRGRKERLLTQCVLQREKHMPVSVALHGLEGLIGCSVLSFRMARKCLLMRTASHLASAKSGYEARAAITEHIAFGTRLSVLLHHLTLLRVRQYSFFFIAA